MRSPRSALRFAAGIAGERAARRVAVVVVALVCLRPAAGRGADVARLVFEPAAPHSGEAVLVTVETAEPARSVQVSVAGARVTMRRAALAQVWYGLAGIDVDARADAVPATVDVELRDGRHVTLESKLNVVARAYPVRRIRVARQFTEPTPEQAARAEREAKRLRAVFAEASEPRWNGTFLKPVGGAATSGFGRRSIVNGKPGGVHAGIDLAAATGTPVASPNAGRVVLAEDLFFSGNTVVLDHGAGLFSLLAHLSRIDVHEGDEIGKGAPVGAVGATGRVTGPHLHWTVRLGPARIDPLSLIRASEAAPTPGTTPGVARVGQAAPRLERPTSP